MLGREGEGAVQRRLAPIAIVVLALLLCGCGSRSDPFVGYWLQAGDAATMRLNVALQQDGQYSVMWDDGSGGGAMRLDVSETSPGVFSDSVGDTFRIIGTTTVEMRFTHAGAHRRADFEKLTTGGDEGDWDPD